MIGVDYDLFWTLDPKSLDPFVKAFRLKEEYDMNKQDVIAYRTGDYVRMAIASNFDKQSKYPEKPYGFKSQKELDDEARMEELKERVMRQAELINKRYGN